MKIFIYTVIFVFLSLFPLSSEQLTTVAVINVDKIFNNFYRDSEEVRDLETMRDEFQKEVDTHINNLNKLRLNKTNALEDGAKNRVEILDQEIIRLTDFIDSLSKQRRSQLEQKRQSLISDEFVRALQVSTRFISESEGYSIVLRSDTEGLLWWASIVDITDKVLTHLFQSNIQN